MQDNEETDKLSIIWKWPTLLLLCCPNYWLSLLQRKSFDHDRMNVRICEGILMAKIRFSWFFDVGINNSLFIDFIWTANNRLINFLAFWIKGIKNIGIWLPRPFFIESDELTPIFCVHNLRNFIKGILTNNFRWHSKFFQYLDFGSVAIHLF